MSNPLPSALALTNIADSSLVTAAPHRNNYAAVQAAVNALIAALGGGAAGQFLQAVDGTDVVWGNAADKSSAATQVFAGAITTGPTTTNAGGGGVAGALISGDSGMYTVGALTANSVIAASITSDSGTGYRFKLIHDGGMSWGPGGASVPTDTTLARSIAGVLKVGNALREVRGTIAYSASMTPNAALGEWFLITATNTTAFTINAPLNPPGANETQFLTIEIKNSSGGVLGAITWDTIYKGFTATLPANGLSTALTFRWNGSAWVCVGFTAAGQTY